MKSFFKLIIPVKLGLESLVAEELRRLGYTRLNVKNGEVEFEGDEKAVILTNLWLRTAERVFICLAEFPAVTFDQIYENTFAVNWPEFIPENGFMHVYAKCVLSQIMSGKSCQSIVKKAIVDRMKKAYRKTWFEESGPEFDIHIELMKDTARLLLDTSGSGLHRRGYRPAIGLAPLRETLAAALLMLSKWKPEIPLFDPFCGSGTIPIEAALLARRQAPGLKRAFSAEQWPLIPSELWRFAREEAESAIRHIPLEIAGSDIDPSLLSLASENAARAGVEDCLHFTEGDALYFRPEGERGMVICNPPYGERLLDVRSSEALYRQLGKIFIPKKNWSYHVLSPHPSFERLFGRKARRNRKMYNGKIKCYFYSFTHD